MPSNVLLKKETSLEFQNSYNDKQVAKILDIINTRSELELSLFNISKQRVKKIETRKQKQGKFSTLEDILELDGFGVKVLEKFCDSILTSEQDGNEKKSNSSKIDKLEEELLISTRKKQQFVSPALLETFRQSITSCVSFHIDLNCIAWTKMSLNSQHPDDDTNDNVISVDDWMCYEIGNNDKKRSLSDLIQILMDINNEIPFADSYVLEALYMPQVAKQPGNPVHMSINVEKSQFFAMFSMLMASREGKLIGNSEENNAKEQQKIFFLRSFLASRLYKVYVGTERVSTEQVIENILRYNYSENQPKNLTFSSIHVPLSLRQHYEGCNKLEREYMGQSMLVGLAFMKLCVLKCANSLKQLNKRN